MDKSRLKKYVNPALGLRMIWFMGMLLLLSMAYLLYSDKEGGVRHVLTCGGVIFTFVYLNIYTMIKLMDSRRYLKELEENKDYINMKEDFSLANSMLRDQVRLGRDYLFVKGRGAILRFCDLKSGFIEVKKHSRGGKTYYLWIRVDLGPDVNLGIVYSPNDKAADVLMEAIKEKNPAFQGMEKSSF